MSEQTVGNNAYPLWGLGSPANLLTASRIVLTPVLVWIIIAYRSDLGASWWAFALGAFLAFTDLIDGLVARRDDNVSRLGAFLDPLADKFVVIGAAFAFVAVDRYWILPVVLITLREVAVSLLRSWYATKGLAIPARKSAKWKSTVQGAALLLAALPPLIPYDLFLELALWVAVAFTLWTGAKYFMDGSAATRTTGTR